MPGPQSKDPSRRARRNAGPVTVKLPAEGRKGRPPAWPLLADVSLATRLKFAEEQSTLLREQWAAEEDGRKARGLARRLEAAEVVVAEARQRLESVSKLERDMWADLWRTPQSTMWEKTGWTREVAQYVRWKVRGELGDLDASKEARMMADRLGLTPLAMRNLHWEIVPDALAEKRTEKAAAAKKSAPTGSRARRGPLRAV